MVLITRDRPVTRTTRMLAVRMELSPYQNSIRISSVPKNVSSPLGDASLLSSHRCHHSLIIHSLIDRALCTAATLSLCVIRGSRPSVCTATKKGRPTPCKNSYSFGCLVGTHVQVPSLCQRHADNVLALARRETLSGGGVDL